MTITLRWADDARTAIIQDCVSPITTADLHGVHAPLQAMFDSVPHTVDVVIVANGGAQFTGNTLAVLRNLAARTHPRQRYVVVINPGPFLTALNGVLRRLLPKAAATRRSFPTLAEALAWLNTQHTAPVAESS